jgi:hypothetical protein
LLSDLLYESTATFQVGPVLTDLADKSCEKHLSEMMDRKLGDLLCDSTYSSAHWHANEITTIAFNASSGAQWLLSICYL